MPSWVEPERVFAYIILDGADIDWLRARIWMCSSRCGAADEWSFSLRDKFNLRSKMNESEWAVLAARSVRSCMHARSALKGSSHTPRKIGRVTQPEAALSLRPASYIMQMHKFRLRYICWATFLDAHDRIWCIFRLLRSFRLGEVKRNG